MKTRHIILCAIGIAAVALGVIFFKGLKRHNERVEKIRHIPRITLATIDGETFSLHEQAPGRRTALLFFSPDCEYCRKEIEGIIAKRRLFNGVDWVFVTLATEDDLYDFCQEYPLGSIPDARIVREDWSELYSALEVSAPPALFIYNADGILEHHHRGAVSINTILEWLK